MDSGRCIDSSGVCGYFSGIPIDLALGARPISKASYKMALKKLKELKIQL